jgi:hypothetical protein
MRRLGEVQLRTEDRSRTILRKDLVVGVNDTGGHFVRIRDDGSIAYVIDKVCDHAGGRLILKEGKAVCPMHGWRLDLDDLRYNDSHVRKSTTDHTLDQAGNIVLSEAVGHLFDPFKGEKKGAVRVRWLNSCHGACGVQREDPRHRPWLFDRPS